LYDDLDQLRGSVLTKAASLSKFLLLIPPLDSSVTMKLEEM